MQHLIYLLLSENMYLVFLVGISKLHLQSYFYSRTKKIYFSGILLNIALPCLNSLIFKYYSISIRQVSYVYYGIMLC